MSLFYGRGIVIVRVRVLSTKRIDVMLTRDHDDNPSLFRDLLLLLASFTLPAVTSEAVFTANGLNDTYM